MKRILASRVLAIGLASLGLVLGSAVAADAQDKYPTKPIRVLLPYAPGGATDIIARLLGEQIRKSLGQPFVVDSKPGAGGILAIEEMARAKPDGYTLQIGNVTSNVITPLLYTKKMSINYEKDVVAVARLIDIPSFVAVTTTDFPPKTFAEFIDYAKKNPGKVRYGTVGVGSFPHYDAEVLARRAGLDMIHIPNKAGASGAAQDLATGDHQVTFINVATATPLIRGGQARALAVVSPERLPDYPDVPTMAEVGFPGVGTMQWQAMFAPAGTPPEVLAVLAKATAEAFRSPEFLEQLKKQNMRPTPTNSPAEAQAWLRSEVTAWRKIMDEVKVDVNE